VRSNLVEGSEQTGDVFVGLVVTPSVARLAVGIVEAVEGRLLNTN